MTTREKYVFGLDLVPKVLGAEPRSNTKRKVFAMKKREAIGQGLIMFLLMAGILLLAEVEGVTLLACTATAAISIFVAYYAAAPLVSRINQPVSEITKKDGE